MPLTTPEKIEEAFDEWRMAHYLGNGVCADEDAEHCAYMCGFAFAITLLETKQ